MRIEEFLRKVGEPLAKHMLVDPLDIGIGATGELLGVITEGVVDAFLKGWLSKAVQAIGGAVALYAATSPKVAGPTKRLLAQYAFHELGRIVDAKPNDIKELKKSIDELVEAIKSGDWMKALKSGVRDIESEWGEVVGLFQGVSLTSETSLSPELVEFKVEGVEEAGGETSSIEEAEISV